MATSVVDSIAHIFRIYPDKFLSIIEPFHLKLLLANGAKTVGKGRVIWNCKILDLGIPTVSGARPTRVGSIFHRALVLIVFDLAILNPILDSCH